MVPLDARPRTRRARKLHGALRIVSATVATAVLVGCAGTPAPERLEAADRQTAIGLHLFREGHVSEAARRFDEALDAVPDHPQALAGRGLVREQQGNYAAALSDHQRAVDNDPDNPALQNNLGRLLCRKGETELAYHAFRAAAETPDYASAHVPWTNAALCAIESRDPARARAFAERATDRMDGYPPALAVLGEVAARDGDHEQALSWYEAYFEQVPAPQARALYWAGRAEAALGNEERAAEHWSAVHEQAPDSRYAARLEQEGVMP